MRTPLSWSVVTYRTPSSPQGKPEVLRMHGPFRTQDDARTCFAVQPVSVDSTIKTEIWQSGYAMGVISTSPNVYQILPRTPTRPTTLELVHSPDSQRPDATRDDVTTPSFSAPASPLFPKKPKEEV